MYEEHSVFKPPQNPNQKIWRYMDFAKFVSLISTSALYFAAADKMLDKFEGSYSRANVDFRKEWYKEVPFDFHEQLGAYWRMARSHTYLSCWHMADYESAAMWELYQAEGRGVAVRSTFKNLRDSLQAPQPIYIGVVDYISYEKDVIPENNAFYPYVHKRRSFEHERELRALTQNPNHLNAPGDPERPFTNMIPVDLAKLINAVYVAPEVPDWYRAVVQSVVEKYGLKLAVKRSSLDKDPIF